MSIELTTHDFYLRHTDTQGHSVVREHRVWDSDRFFEARLQEVKELNAKARADDEKALACVVPVSRETYIRERDEHRR